MSKIPSPTMPIPSPTKWDKVGVRVQPAARAYPTLSAHSAGEAIVI